MAKPPDNPENVVLLRVRKGDLSKALDSATAQTYFAKFAEMDKASFDAFEALAASRGMTTEELLREGLDLLEARNRRPEPRGPAEIARPVFPKPKGPTLG